VSDEAELQRVERMLRRTPAPEAVPAAAAMAARNAALSEPAQVIRVSRSHRWSGRWRIASGAALTELNRFKTLAETREGPSKSLNFSRQSLNPSVYSYFSIEANWAIPPAASTAPLQYLARIRPAVESTRKRKARLELEGQAVPLGGGKPQELIRLFFPLRPVETGYESWWSTPVQPPSARSRVGPVARR